MGPEQMGQIAGWMERAVAAAGDDAALARIRGEVVEVCRRFPAPGILIAD
jgi:glycine hydroxymethyltransferase